MQLGHVQQQNSIKARATVLLQRVGGEEADQENA
jgi:hypothetical protein